MGLFNGVIDDKDIKALGAEAERLLPILVASLGERIKGLKVVLTFKDGRAELTLEDRE